MSHYADLYQFQADRYILETSMQVVQSQSGPKETDKNKHTELGLQMISILYFVLAWNEFQFTPFTYLAFTTQRKDSYSKISHSSCIYYGHLQYLLNVLLHCDYNVCMFCTRCIL